MEKNSETNLLKRVCKKTVGKKRIEKGDVKKLTAALGERFTKALESVKRKGVKKYIFTPSKRVVWIVVGRERDYLIMPAADFCTCDDFYFRVMDKQAHLCYHLIAQKLAQTLENYVLYKEEDELYEVLMKEWKKAIA